MDIMQTSLFPEAYKRTMDSEQADDAPDSNEVNTSQFEKLQEFVESMPKVELHAHLNGCIRESTLFALAKERNVTLSEHHFVQSSTFSANTMYNVRPRSLKDCFDMFAEIPKCVDDLVALRRITREALEDFAQHHVAYLELRSTPKRLVSVHRSKEGVLSKREYVETVVSVLEAFEREEQARYERGCETNPSCRLPLVPRFIVSVDRSDSVENAMEHVHLAIDMLQSGNTYVVGVDLGGNPTKNDFRDFEAAFQLARSSGLKVTLHCGEVPCGEAESIDIKEDLSKAYEEALAVLRFRPDRLGHALLLPGSLQSILDESHIPIETCPTSNIMTLELATSFHGNLVEGFQRHPRLAYWLRTGYPISVSTDDSGVFHTDPTKELLLLVISHGVDRHLLRKIVMQSIQHAFCDDRTKSTLAQRVAHRLSYKSHPGRRYS